jgi:5-methyltetrahydrofolate--homocysteine methyltransferase
MDTVFKTLKKDVILFDGGMGTELMKRLGKPEISPWENLLHPETVVGIHKDYCAAGCDVLTANTFGAYALKARGRFDADAAARRAIGNAQAALSAFPDKKRLIALDVGSLGALIEPYGDLSETEAFDNFARLIKSGAGADFICIETMSDLNECRIALEAARAAGGLPVVVSMTFDERGRTFMGATIEQFAELAGAFRVAAAGFNCGLPPEKFPPLVREWKRRSGLPLIVRPNADAATAVEDFAKEAAALVEAGVPVIGGCCGTGPEHIKALRERLRELRIEN